MTPPPIFLIHSTLLLFLSFNPSHSLPFNPPIHPSHRTQTHAHHQQFKRRVRDEIKSQERQLRAHTRRERERAVPRARELMHFSRTRERSSHTRSRFSHFSAQSHSFFQVAPIQAQRNFFELLLTLSFSLALYFLSLKASNVFSR